MGNSAFVMAPLPNPTPQERLATSRKAMVRHMTRYKRGAQNTYAEDANNAEDTAAHHSTADGTWRILKHAVRTWWHHHPVNVAMEIARPVLNQYAREHPVKLVGIAAGIGVATVLLRPWRLVSLGTVVAAALKPPQLPNFLLSMLSPHLSGDPSDSRSGNERDRDNDFSNTDTDTRPP